MSWSRRFDEPIQPPKGKKLVTLKDAAAYILALPKSKQQSPEWQAAGEAVIMAAEDRGPLSTGLPNATDLRGLKSCDRFAAQKKAAKLSAELIPKRCGYVGIGATTWKS